MYCARGIFCEKENNQKKISPPKLLIVIHSFRLIKRSGGIGNNNFEVRALGGPQIRCLGHTNCNYLLKMK
jgi:hypothetical protein